MTNREILKQLMKDNGCTRQEFSELLRIPLSTLNSYLLPITSRAHRLAPDNFIELARYKLKDLKNLSTTDGKIKRFY